MDEASEKPRQTDMFLPSPDPALDSTYVRGFDEILGGGLARGSLLLLAGPPGSGKTILVTEMAFHVAAHGGHALIFSTFSEPTNKLLTHIRNLAFYQHEQVGRTIEFLNIQQFLREGLDETIEEVVRTARQRRAAFVALDSFAGIRDVAGSEFEGRKFVYEIGNRLNMLGTTTAITSEANAQESRFFPEAATADVVVNLRFDTVGVRARRSIEVIKARGAEPLVGLHAVVIDQHGVWIIPKVEARALLALPAQSPQNAEPDHTVPLATEGDATPTKAPPTRISIGLPWLDDRLGGGLVPSTATLVVGTLGAGKTMLGLHFALAGVRAQEPTLFLSFRESAEQLLLHSSAFSWKPELMAASATGRLKLVSILPIEIRTDIVVEQLIALLDAHHIRRLVIDGISELERAISANGFEDRMDDFFAALLQIMRLHGVTALFLRNTPEALQDTQNLAHGPISLLTDNLIWLRQEMRGDQFVRILAILQTRFSAHSMQSVQYAIAAPEGILMVGAARPFTPKSARRAPRAGLADH